MFRSEQASVEQALFKGLECPLQRADPVHLMPAGDQLVMLDQGLLSLSQDEAKGLVREVLQPDV